MVAVAIFIIGIQETELMTCEKSSVFFKNTCTPFLVIALILLSSFSIRSGICKEYQENRALDEKVEKFLDSRNGTWHDWNIPYSDGKILHDLVLKNNHKKALEIGTSTGHSAIWIAWALS